MQTAFPLTPAQIAQADGYTLMMSLEQFWRANGMRTGQNLTNGERLAEALHWAKAVQS